MLSPEKQAAFALIQAIEIQLHSLKAILGMDASNVAPTPKDPQALPKSSELEYLTEEEEDALEDAMESARLDAIKESELISSQWEKQRQAIEDAESML